MVRISLGISRRMFVWTAVGGAVLGGVVRAGPASADWPADQSFSIASVKVSGTCLSAEGELVVLKSCSGRIEQTWLAIDGTRTTRVRNVATGQCLLAEPFDGAVRLRGVDCAHSGLSNQRWKYLNIAGYTDRGVIQREAYDRGSPSRCWQAFTYAGGPSGTGAVGSIRTATDCEMIKGDALPAENLWMLEPTR
ncbi:hypothetical protein [Nocardia brasiliensis]|uniref:hypothetical protein n=1 Tax=Nocardia brasiliensis TaxID=37326 RepID=UPI0024576711|nr:hypothetical protein [Nocardia brasiliensis]